jgi:tetratricopeptide (TPR) repeat protein
MDIGAFCMNKVNLLIRIFRISLIVLSTLSHKAVFAEITSFDQAEKLIENYTSNLLKSPDNAELYVLRGDVYFLIHEFESAVEDYSTAIQLDRTIDAAYFGRGLAYGRQGFINEGIKDLSHYIKQNPKSSLAYTKRGVRYLWLGDKDNAFNDLNKAIALDSNNAEAHDDLGVVLAQKGDYREAIKHFLTTIHIEPGYQKGYHNLAMAYYVTENDVLALNSVNESLRLKPMARNSILLKAKILVALGKIEEAATLEEDATFMPEGDWSEEVPMQ